MIIRTLAPLISALVMLAGLIQPAAIAQSVELTALGRFDGWRENHLIGQGLVVGLSGSGDSRRSLLTRQELRSALSRFGTVVDEDDLSSRNVAAVWITGMLPASANVGDRLTITVSSSGDARSLAGGVLLTAPLYGPDQNVYALAQGPLLAGGYHFQSDLNIEQRNFPTTGRVVDGATVERPVSARLLDSDGNIRFLLLDPSFQTAQRIKDAIDQRFGQEIATVESADEIVIRLIYPAADVASFLADLEIVEVEPHQEPRVVINERTGTVVAGANVRLSSVVISQGDIRVSVIGENFASQPLLIGGRNDNISSLVISNTSLEVDQGSDDAVLEFPSSTVVDLVQGLSDAGVDTRRTIGILQAMKSAGALHADIVVQ